VPTRRKQQKLLRSTTCHLLKIKLKIKTMKDERYNPIKQPVSYAIAYGFVPEIRELLKPLELNHIMAECRIKGMCLDDRLLI